MSELPTRDPDDYVDSRMLKDGGINLREVRKGTSPRDKDLGKTER